MMNEIDLTTLPSNVPSLCIPRVFPNIDERRIRNVFETLDMGEIERVDIIKKTTEKGDKFNRVFIHWKRWNNSDNAVQSRKRLLNGKEIKIIYDDPWFWKISAYREPTIKYSAKPLAKKGPVRIQFDTQEDRRPKQEDRRPKQEDRRPKQEDRRPKQEDRRPKNHHIKKIECTNNIPSTNVCKEIKV